MCKTELTNNYVQFSNTVSDSTYHYYLSQLLISYVIFLVYINVQVTQRVQITGHMLSYKEY